MRTSGRTAQDGRHFHTAHSTHLMAAAAAGRLFHTSGREDGATFTLYPLSPQLGDGAVPDAGIGVDTSTPNVNTEDQVGPGRHGLVPDAHSG